MASTVLRRHFAFGWVGAPELANSVAMMHLPVPSLLVIKPDTYQYFLPEGEHKEQPPSPQAVLELLNTILDGSAVVSSFATPVGAAEVEHSNVHTIFIHIEVDLPFTKTATKN